MSQKSNQISKKHNLQQLELFFDSSCPEFNGEAEKTQNETKVISLEEYMKRTNAHIFIKIAREGKSF